MALELVHQENGGILRRLRGMLARPRAVLSEGELPGAVYHVIRAPCPRGEPDWEEIAEIAGPMAGRMLLPEGVFPPDGCGIRRLESSLFARKVLLATACELVARSRMQMYRRVLGLIDPGAEYIDLLPRLLRHYTSVRVLTRERDRYGVAAERMMEELGAPVQVCAEDAGFGECVLILAPGEAMGGLFSSPVLAGERYRAQKGGELITELKIEIARAVEEACPRGIEGHAFAAALHDHCSVEPESFAAVTVRWNYRVVPLAEAARLLARRAGDPGAGGC